MFNVSVQFLLIHSDAENRERVIRKIGERLARISRQNVEVFNCPETFSILVTDHFYFIERYPAFAAVLVSDRVETVPANATVSVAEDVDEHLEQLLRRIGVISEN